MKTVEHNTSIEYQNKNKNGNMIQHQVMNGVLTNEITNKYMNEIEEDSCKKN